MCLKNTIVVDRFVNLLAAGPHPQLSCWILVYKGLLWDVPCTMELLFKTVFVNFINATLSLTLEYLLTKKREFCWRWWLVEEL